MIRGALGRHLHGGGMVAARLVFSAYLSSDT